MFVTELKTTIPCSTSELFSYLTRREVFERLLPPWEREDVVSWEGSLRKEGSQIVTRVVSSRLALQKVWEVCNVEEDRELTLRRLGGPLQKWVQTMSLIAIDESTTELHERIECSFSIFKRATLIRRLKWRHLTLLSDLAMLKKYSSGPKRILVSGASGMIGSALSRFLKVAGLTVVPLVRSKGALKEGAVFWDPTTEELRVDDFEGFDGVVHLAGRNIAKHFWTKKERELIFRSRVRDTWLLSKILSRQKHPPKVVITASGVGFYGSRGAEALTEEASKGEGFFADLVEKWEGATASLLACGVRVVHARMGAVLSTAGGMLGKMLLPFKWCLGGRLGDGKQLLSFIDIDDAVHAIYFSLLNSNLSGPINVTAPEVLTQEAFVSMLGHALHRKEPCHMRAALLRMLFGDMADEVLLISCHAVPKRLLDEGFEFSFPTFQDSLKHFL